MEPITAIFYTLTTFFGYYVGADMYNYIKFKNEFNEIKYKLDTINESLNRLDRITSSLPKIHS